MNKDFYEALYEFNLNNKKPLYLLQGISLNEVAIDDGEDIQGEKKFQMNLKKHRNNCGCNTW